MPKMSFLKSLWKKVSQAMQEGVCSDEVKSNKNEWKSKNLLEFILLLRDKKKEVPRSPLEKKLESTKVQHKCPCQM